MTEAALFYEAAKTGLGDLFLDDVRRAIDTVGSAHTSVSPCHMGSGARLSDAFNSASSMRSKPRRLSSSPWRINDAGRTIGRSEYDCSVVSRHETNALERWMSGTKITIIHDSFGHMSSLKKDWGFSAHLDFDGQRILFDTGNNAKTFSENCSVLGLDLRNLDYAVISHRHGDHTSGLNHLLKVNPKLTVYTPDETYGVFGSSLFGTFYPRCHSLPRYFQYYDGNPPEVIRHGSPWPDAKFVWVKEITEPSPGVFLIPVVSDVPGTREMREISMGLRTSRGLILIAGCSHPGVEKILEASRAIADRVLCIFGGLHLVLTKEPEIRRVVSALRDDWHVERIAPGHCTGEPAFAAIQEIFGERCLFAGLGESIEL